MVEDMNWAMESDETDAPDGTYSFHTTMFDYRSNTKDHTFLGWHSHIPVEVRNGHINKTQALAAAGHLMGSCGYWGRYLEAAEYDPVTKSFEITVGS
jgi:hypothetical protein